MILAPAEDILILSQDNGNFAVEARSERGAHIRVTGQADPCGAEDIELGPGFAIERAAWDASPTRERAARLKAVFQGWAAVADLLCPGRPHRLELRRLDAALSQFDGQLAWGTP